MSENRNSNDDFERKLNEFADQAYRKITETGKVLTDRFNVEKEKAQIRSEIGHNTRDLSKAYEKLGRQYYEKVVAGQEMVGEKDTFDLIRSKEKLIELLTEKLEGMETK